MRLGEVEITRVEDYHGPGFKPGVMFPEFQPEMWQSERDWLVPAFYDPVAGQIRTSIHSWLVRTPRHTILIDSCIGNHKPRPSIDRFNMRNEPWLERLQAAGARPEEIDFVMCTHLHADHVGWNTRLQDGRWVPTFPNARYLFTKAELDRWDDRQPGFVTRPINQFVFADSILPVIEAGQVVLVEDGHCVDDALTVEAAPGHTCGHVKIRVKSGEREGMFTGDTIHHPIQLPYPKLCSTFDEDPVQAMHTRLAMLEECASRNILLLPTHFADPFSCWIEAKGTAEPSYRALWNHG